MTTVRDALGAVLLFHGHIGPWDEATRESWRALTGVDEATTRVLCDAVRAALATLDAEVVTTPQPPAPDPGQVVSDGLASIAAAAITEVATRTLDPWHDRPRVDPEPAIEPSLDPYQDRQVRLLQAAARVADALATREGKPLERSVAELLVLLVLHIADR